MPTHDIYYSILITCVTAMLAKWLTWHLRDTQAKPSMRHTLAIAIVESMQSTIYDVLGDHADTVLPLIGTLWIYIVCANLLNLIPGFHSPTTALSTTTALALVVFFAVHWYGIKISGFRGYYRHYTQPSIILLPFHIVSELSRTLAMAIRLFGNMMSLEIAAMLVLMVAGLLVPIPLLMLHIVEAIIQAYLFGMLAMIYIASGIQSHIVYSNQKRSA